ncbi:MAG TPA: terminase small subunit [Candidatus Gastranaerophilaceae bacterium]|nr:terminase small subunit [Candidatus Gastranaerophilaceae bacterium]HPT40774.1 terminase small subunit [Candidatus Gastranaerophilaceae bacterium]
MTQQQKKFVAEYIKTLDLELSAKNAGYKTKDYKNVAQKLLSDKLIINEIKNQIKRQISSLVIQKGYIVKKLLDIVEFSLEEEDILDKDAQPSGKKKLRDTTAGLRALESLCKHLGFANKSDEEPSETKIITISNLDEDKI